MAKLLVVEDDRAIRNLIVRNLELVGHCCFQSDGTDALKIIESQKFDLMIFDVMLPNFSGFDLITMVDNTPVIFVTAKDSASDRMVFLLPALAYGTGSLHHLLCDAQKSTGP